jgi:cytochrome c oxidase subunit 3
MSFFSELGDKSWATQGVAGEIRDRSLGPGPAAKTGLKFFLFTLSSMFFLFVAGYRLRMAEADWQPLVDPSILWLNTALLILAGVIMHRARDAAKQNQTVKARNNLIAAGVLTFAFLLGQYQAWQQLSSEGYSYVTSPAVAFFVLLTGLHALHLLCGLLVWGRAVWRVMRGADFAKVRLSIELCTTYWHYLLMVWFVFFALLLST